MNTQLEQEHGTWSNSLRAVLRGEVIAAGDPGYDESRSVYLTGVDARPALVCRPRDAADVGRTIRFARDADLPLAVRSGGHSVVGHGVVEGGLVIDLTALRSFELNVADRSVWAGTGLTAGEFTRAAGAQGLATGFGDSATVGIGGITLGGGVGFLHRRYGLTIDNLLAAEIVTADGRVLMADAENHPDLFWAIRGGGGNFGVATRFRFRLAEVDAVYGGMLMLPATPRVVATFIEEALAAPEAMSGMIGVTLAPAMPFLPAEVHGTPIIMAAMVFAGAADAGEKAFAPFRALATPIVDQVGPIRYPQVFDGPAHPHPVSMTLRSLFVDRVEEQTVEELIHLLRASPATMSVAQFRIMGGAVAEIAADATAFPHRSQPIMATVAAAAYEPSPDQAAYDGWADRMAAALDRGLPGAYVSFLGDEGEARIRAAYHGATWDRLRAIKKAYDPTNLFRLNQNVPPAE